MDDERRTPGSFAVGDTWRARRPEAIRAIATGQRALHAVAIDNVVLVHGDACAPNTLISIDCEWTGHVGDLAIGNRWADLVIALLSLDWNSAEGHQDEFFDAYGIEPDHSKIEYHRAPWQLESRPLVRDCCPWPRSCSP